MHSLRNTSLKIHRWIGLNSFIFLSYLFLTGAIMVFATELETVFQPDIWVGSSRNETHANFGEIYDTVQRAYPGSHVVSIDRHPSPWLADRTYTHTASAGEISVWTDPVSAEILGATSATSFKRLWREAHENLFVPRRVVGLALTSTSVVLIAMILTGLITYRRFWRGVFRLPHNDMTPRNWWAIVHRLIALWMLPFLIIVSLTTFVFFLEFLGIRGTSPSPIPGIERNGMLPRDLNGTMIDKAYAIASGSAPDLQIGYFGTPRKNNAGLVFTGTPEGTIFYSKRASVFVDPTNMTVLSTRETSDSTGMARLSPLVEALHYGLWGGAFSKILWFLFGITGSILFMAGSMVYAARAGAMVTEAKNTQDNGRFRQIIRGLGIFKWAYLALFLAIPAAFISRHILYL